MADYDDAWHDAWYRRMEEGGGNIIAAMRMRMVEEGPERVVMSLAMGPAVRQGTGVFAAGALMQLADVGATSLYFNALRADGVAQPPFPLSIQVSVSLVRNTKTGRAISESRFLHRGRSLVVVESRVTDEQDASCAPSPAPMCRVLSNRLGRVDRTRCYHPLRMPDLKSFDRVAHLYDETRGMPEEAERQVAYGLAAALHKIDPQPHLLEVGIGTGRVAVPLAARGVRITGIDISTKMLAILRGKRADIGIGIAEASRLPFRDGAFDGALFVHILHLVPDPEATIRATVAAVRPGGVVIAAGDDREDSRRTQADELIRETVLELSGVDIGGWTPYARGMELFDRVLREHGATIEFAPLARWTSSTTARRMLERLKRRDYSSSWKIPDEIMPSLLERVSPRIAELFGGMDAPVEYERSFSMRLARLPA